MHKTIVVIVNEVNKIFSITREQIRDTVLEKYKDKKKLDTEKGWSNKEYNWPTSERFRNLPTWEDFDKILIVDFTNPEKEVLNNKTLELLSLIGSLDNVEIYLHDDQAKCYCICSYNKEKDEYVFEHLNLSDYIITELHFEERGGSTLNVLLDINNGYIVPKADKNILFYDHYVDFKKQLCLSRGYEKIDFLNGEQMKITGKIINGKIIINPVSILDNNFHLVSYALKSTA